ncbi:DUF3289 family protein [Lelliottia amnigena]|uniref:DUF3289 family protein n=1 Tax=Lelliottia amnigena TaxID=61646 RepID=A0AAP2AEU1_LELAM|nr:DUF3289 family protein [Lelliottia amnigena]MBL5935854.1 DUF3289 family protein [Lelliottia amnigena]
MGRPKNKTLRIFRIFLLQRYNQFGYKPFITNMETTVIIHGRRND